MIDYFDTFRNMNELTSLPYNIITSTYEFINGINVELYVLYLILFRNLYH